MGEFSERRKFINEISLREAEEKAKREAEEETSQIINDLKFRERSYRTYKEIKSICPDHGAIIDRAEVPATDDTLLKNNKKTSSSKNQEDSVNQEKSEYNMPNILKGVGNVLKKKNQSEENSFVANNKPKIINKPSEEKSAKEIIADITKKIKEL